MPDSPVDVKTPSRLTPPTMPPPPTTQGAPRTSSFTPTTLTNGTSHSPTALNGAPSPPNGFSNGPSSSSSSSLANQQLPPACGARQLSKLKRFLTTLQQFGNDISPEIGERVRTLVLGLVVSRRNAAQLGGRERAGETPGTGCVFAALLFHTWSCVQAC
ncbi:RUNX1T1 [Cervus elaphus hippelaphus]|uniref:RUNX1T1 n=1 Tax=Cervus elaphus hippelaphus TaxID=46360 RepID=A0A212CEM9_CEREH|nr:RUNX1T1 [Cervus elaphus hippelaphus]